MKRSKIAKHAACSIALSKYVLSKKEHLEPEAEVRDWVNLSEKLRVCGLP